MQNFDLKQLFVDNLCSFEVAKLAKQAGATCANTYFAYDKFGKINTGGWLESVGFDSFFPCINLAFAISMLSECQIDFFKVEIYELEGMYYFKYHGCLELNEKNLPDLLVKAWIKYKNYKPGEASTKG